MKLRYYLSFFLWTVCLPALYAQGFARSPIFSGKAQMMDSLHMKKLVKLTCGCFQDLKSIDFPSPQDRLLGIESEEDEAKRARRDSTEKALQGQMDKIFLCAQKQIKDNKKVLGLEALPDSLLEYHFNKQSPPVFFEYMGLSPSVMVYFVRDCPYTFMFLEKFLNREYEITQKRRVEIDSIARVREAVRDTSVLEIEKNYTVTEEPDSEFYENSFTKQFKAKLKAIENKGVPILVVERMIDKKPKQERLLILQRMENEGNDIIKAFKQYKGKEVIIQVYKEELFDAKTNMFELHWRVTSLKLAK